MASQSLYRKWRSQTFSDLVGQEAVVRTLLNAVRDGRLAHAYLFCGPRGTGKTSVARLLAKAVNCANPHDGEPCNECISCQEITAGRSPDVIEIDAASNTGVDNIRDLRESVNLLGTGGHYRVFVVDEVHMLSTQAFNALLKTLEEPPPHVIFVLATTEAHKVLPTIVSRCQRFNFGRFSMRELVARLRHVAQGEGLELEPTAADLLARAAQGGMRDALSLLDQAMAFCGTQIDLERTRAMLGLADPGAIRRIIEHVAAQESAEGLHLINEMVANGADLRQLNAQLSDEWRALVLARAGADVAALMDRSEDEARDIKALAQRFSLEELTACARVFAKNETPARGLPVPQLALELSFLECLAIKRNGGALAVTQPATQAASSPLPPIPRMPEGSRAAKDAPRGLDAGMTPSLKAPSGAAPGASIGAGTARKGEETPGIEELDLAALADEAVAPLPVATPIEAFGEPVPENLEVGLDELPLPPEPVDEAPVDDDDLFADDDTPAPYASDTYADWLGQVQNKWPLVKQVCKQKSVSVAALLNGARPVLVEPGDDVPILVLQTAIQFHFEKLRDAKSRAAVEWALEQVLSAPLRMRIMLENGNGAGPAGPAGNSGPRGGSSPSAPRAPSSPNGHSPLPAGEGPGVRSGKNGNQQGNGQPRPVPPDAQPSGHDIQNAISGKNGNRIPPLSTDVGASGWTPSAGARSDPGKNGNRPSGHNGHSEHNGASAVHDAAEVYMPANVTPIRPIAKRQAARLEDEVRADAVIQTLLDHGIELADVRPLQDEDKL